MLRPTTDLREGTAGNTPAVPEPPRYPRERWCPCCGEILDIWGRCPHGALPGHLNHTGELIR